MPKNIKRSEPINIENFSESSEEIVFPINIEKLVIINEIENNIKLLIFEILVYFIPYEIPIPRESILTERANKIQFNNIKISPI